MGAGASALFRGFGQSPLLFSGSAEVTSAPPTERCFEFWVQLWLVFFLPVIVIAEIGKPMQEKLSSLC